MKITVIIPARGGSKRLKNKNIYPIWGKPMIFWAIKACKESSYNLDIWVSTDSEEISEVSKSFGANVILRGEDVSNDKAFKQSAIRDAAEKIDKIKGASDIYISLQPNSPEITSLNLDKGIESLINNNKDEIISVDSNFMQNGAFRIFRSEYVYQKDLSTNCGFVVCDLFDVHSKQDVDLLESRKG